jgi:hypothetical protein
MPLLAGDRFGSDHLSIPPLNPGAPGSDAGRQEPNRLSGDTRVAISNRPARFGPTTPTRARRPFDASVDHTEAAQIDATDADAKREERRDRRLASLIEFYAVGKQLV